MLVRNKYLIRKGKNMRKRLREVRKSYKMTQEALANKLNIHRTHYNRIENSYKTITIDTAIKLKQILNYKEDDLFENL